MNEISLEVKAALHQKAHGFLQSQLNTLTLQLTELREAGAKDSKSPAGDKYETQREMIRQSRDLLDIQLARAKEMLFHLQNIQVQLNYSVMEGALVKLSIGFIWVSVPLGKLVLNGTEYQLVSKDSPIFIALKNLKAGDSIIFKGKTMKIAALV